MLRRMRLKLGIDVETVPEEVRVLLAEAPRDGRMIGRFVGLVRHCRHRLVFLGRDGLAPEPPQERIEVHLGLRIGSSLNRFTVELYQAA